MSTPPKTVVGPDISQWWAFKFGADWKHPYGGRSDIRGKLNHPVDHVAYSDAKAYATWAGKICRPKRNGNWPRATATTMSSSAEAMNSLLAASSWPTCGRGRSRQ